MVAVSSHAFVLGDTSDLNSSKDSIHPVRNADTLDYNHYITLANDSTILDGHTLLHSCLGAQLSNVYSWSHWCTATYRCTATYWCTAVLVHSCLVSTFGYNFFKLHIMRFHRGKEESLISSHGLFSMDTFQ